jgi:hypothetical protein
MHQRLYGLRHDARRVPCNDTEPLPLPSGITLQMLPDDCPGWGNYAFALPCGLCDFNLQCMQAQDAVR